MKLPWKKQTLIHEFTLWISIWFSTTGDKSFGTLLVLLVCWARRDPSITINWLEATDYTTHARLHSRYIHKLRRQWVFFPFHNQEQFLGFSTFHECFLALNKQTWVVHVWLRNMWMGLFKDNMYDIFTRSLLTSDPYILKQFKGDIVIRERHEIKPTVRLLLAPEKVKPAFMDIELDW